MVNALMSVCLKGFDMGQKYMENKLSRRLKELRMLSGYNQDYVAGVLNVARQTYGHYENGKRTPKPDVLYKLAGLYQIPVEDLMHLCIDLDQNVYYDAPAPTQTSVEIADMLEYYASPENRERYRNNSYIEKELLFYFDKLDEINKREIIEYTKFKLHRQK